MLARAGAAEPLDNARWWPPQAAPTGIVRSTRRETFTSAPLATEMMLASVAGLAAKAVNDGRGDELVWLTSDNPDVEDWLARTLARAAAPEIRGTFAPWELVDRFARRGIVKGYLLYRADVSRGETGTPRRGMDGSVNIATSLAGILDGIVVDEALEPVARQHGLTRLLDVRERTAAWCFETYKDRFNRALLCTQDPRKPNVRDLAIAQRAFTTFGDADPLPAVMRWLDPLSPILGWNGGDEFATTDLSSRWGQLQTATDWCLNLPVLMAGTPPRPAPRAHHADPAAIDWNDSRSTVSFVSTDGDNVQWWEGNFFRGHEGKQFWGDPERGKIPFGWSGCFAQLAQLCPPAIDYATATQSANDTFIEWGGGYYFPDRFAGDRPDRWALLARHAQRTWALMRANDTRLIGFNVARIDSPDTRKACEIFAGQTDGLLGILLFQYDRYEAGAGATFWVKDSHGLDVPVVSARYALWNHANDRARAGTPAKVAREIRETAASASAAAPRHDWVIAHVWSWFKYAPGTDENAEDAPQENAGAGGARRGYTPALWCAARLPESVRVVSPEEMVWRLRMAHDPARTRALLATWGH